MTHEFFATVQNKLHWAITGKQKLRTKWAALEAMVGTEKRIALVAEDFVSHFEGRLSAMDGRPYLSA
jgi:hypothetical protein